MWSEAFGDAVQASITPIEQGQYIGLALVGSFQAVGWRSHSGLDPDQQRLWWHSTAAAPIGGLALNFGRFRDADMDAALDTIKSNPDPAARRATGSGRGGQPDLRRAGLQLVAHHHPVGRHRAALRQRAGEQRAPRRDAGHGTDRRRAPRDGPTLVRRWELRMSERASFGCRG
jgi:hypothetical protein